MRDKMNFKQINSFKSMENGKIYSYGKNTKDSLVFTFEYKEYRNCVELMYKDGYVGEPSVENFKRHIQEGKVYEHK